MVQPPKNEGRKSDRISLFLFPIHRIDKGFHKSRYLELWRWNIFTYSHLAWSILPCARMKASDCMKVQCFQNCVRNEHLITSHRRVDEGLQETKLAISVRNRHRLINRISFRTAQIKKYQWAPLRSYAREFF